MSLKIIQKNIKQIVTNANKLNMLIHTTGVLVLEHAVAHGDCSTAKDLLNAMPASMRRTMLKLWFETYSPIRFQMNEGLAVKVGMLKDTAKGFTPFNIDDGRETPFSELAEKNPEGKVLDFDAILNMVKGLSKRIDKQIENEKIKPEDIASARAASIALGGLRLVRVDGEAPKREEKLGADLPLHPPVVQQDELGEEDFDRGAADEPVEQPELGLRAVA